MRFKKYYIEDNNKKSNCVVRSLCKVLNKEYSIVFNDLCVLAKELNSSSFNDIEVFETYMENNNIIKVEDIDIKVKELKLNEGIYIAFCWDKKDFYHMIPIIDNVVYDKTDECLNLYTITIYKEKM